MSGARGALPPHVLHVYPQGRARDVIGDAGNRLRHTLVTRDGTMPDGLRQTAYCKPASAFPALGGLPTPGRMQRLARAMTPFDLVLTYGYDALDVAMAHTIFRDKLDLPALVHHEYAADDRPSMKRTWYRRVALGKAAGLVVPGETLEAAALVDWQQPIGRVKRIAPGIDTKAFARRPKKDGFRLIKRDGEFWLGAWPQAKADADLAMLLEAFAALPESWQLVILGDDMRSDALDAAIARLELEDRIYFPGEPRDPARVLGLFDLFFDGAAHGAFPAHVAQVMAAGVPVVAPRQGEAGQMVAAENREWLTDGSSGTLGAHLRALAGDKAARRTIGEANRAHAVRQYDLARTMADYRRLYSSAMKREY